MIQGVHRWIRVIELATIVFADLSQQLNGLAARSEPWVLHPPKATTAIPSGRPTRQPSAKKEKLHPIGFG